MFDASNKEKYARQTPEGPFSFDSLPKLRDYEPTTASRPPHLDFPNSRVSHVTISQIASLGYCEQLAVLDYRLGRHRLAHVERRAQLGTLKHSQFEQESRYLQSTGPLRPTGQTSLLLRAWQFILSILRRISRFF